MPYSLILLLGSLIFMPHFTYAGDGVVARFDFDGDLTSTVGGFQGEEIGNISFGTDRFGDSSSALQLDGSGNVITNLNMSDYFSVEADITLSAWFKTSQSSFRSTVVAGSRPGGGPDFVALLESGKIVTRLYAGSSPVSDEALNDNQWHHIVWGYGEATGGYFYIDGVRQSQTPEPGVLSRDFLSFGAIRESENRFSGYIDDVTIFNKTLTSEEVQNLFNEGVADVEIGDLKQLRVDGKTVVEQGQTVTGNALVFRADVENGEAGVAYALEVEVERVADEFDGEDTFQSAFSDGATLSTKVRDFIKNQDLYGGNNRGDFKWRARIVGDDGSESAWEEYGEEGTDFTLRAVPLMTQQPSPYPSIEDTTAWASKQYAFGRSPECKNTIKGCGCALAALTTLAQYHGITTGADGSSVNPDNLNAWLRTNNGYDGTDNIKFNEAIKYFGTRLGGGAFQSNLKIKTYQENRPNEVRNFVATNGPTVVNAKVPGFTHFFVLDSLLDEGYEVSDPLWYNTDTSNDERSAVGVVQDYNDTINSARLIEFSDTPAIVGRGFEIHLASPATLVVTDALGRKLGHDPRSGVSYNEIPTGEYWAEADISDEEADGPVHETKIATIIDPTASPYTIEVIGEASGEYQLSIYTSEVGGESVLRDFASTTSNAVVHTYGAFYKEDAAYAEIAQLQRFIDWLKTNLQQLPKGVQTAATNFVGRYEPRVYAGTLIPTLKQQDALDAWESQVKLERGLDMVMRVIQRFE